ncbi:hypothetical protein CMUS01_09364 [Colletotrichum musicola]|uniref:Uncharacterized protein n=1 Tax=Colletotrichum musicola TaxID=2175873 RepID=A0A8H6K8A0_9PEZI|nr:hypothetical protein CMUS01_09364 [Colletotrichum musicola]
MVVAIYLVPAVQLFINLYISARLVMWFIWSADCAQVVYNTVYLYPRLRRESKRAWKRWNERPSPPFRSDVFSFLYHDIHSTHDGVEWTPQFYAIICAVKREQLAFAKGLTRSPWWDLLPGRILQSFDTIQPPPISSFRAKFTNPEAMAWVSERGEDVLREAEEQLEVLRDDLVQKLDAARRIPKDMTADEFRMQIDTAWADNPYLACFQRRWGLAPWGASFPKLFFSSTNKTQQLRVIRPHLTFLQFWVNAFQIAVDPVEGRAEIQINEDDFDMPKARDLEKTISAFRVLHVELLRASKGITEDCQSNRQLEAILFETFFKAAGWPSNTLDSTFTCKEHFNEIRCWRPYPSGNRRG